MAKFIRCEAICEAANFLSQSSRRTVDVFVLLRALSNIKDVVQYSSIAKIFYLPEYSKQAKLAKFIHFEAICEAANFLSQSSQRTVDVFLFLRALSNIKDVEIGRAHV